MRLQGALEQFFEEVPYLGFPAAEEVEIRSKINVPSTLDAPSPQLTLRLRILGRVEGELPSLTVTGRRIPRPTGPTSLPTLDTAIVIDTTGAVEVDEYIEVESDPIDVEAGDIFLFTINRSDSDAYPGELGILQQVGIITSGS